SAPAKVYEDMVCIECSDMPKQFLFLRVVDALRIKRADGTGNQSQIGDSAMHDNVLKWDFFVEKIGEGVSGPVQTEEGVKIRTAQVCVKEYGFTPFESQTCPHTAGNEAFACSAFATSDSPYFTMCF
ncbi:MAG: hypothetical protein WCL71_13395, partial [Deltaproteobacteria bacterium]